MRYAAQEVLAVLAEHLQIAPRPAQALPPGLTEAGGLLVVEDGVVTVAYLEAADDAVHGELDVLGEQVEVPAAAVVEHLLREQEARAGDGAAGAEVEAGVVEELRLAQEPQRVAGGDPVVAEVLGVAVARDDAVALGEDLVHLLDVVLLEHVVRVEDEVAVEGPLREELVYAVEQIVEGVALAHVGGVEALKDYGPGVGGDARRVVRAVVGHDEGGHQAAVIGLAPDALDEVADDGLLVPRGHQHRVAVAHRLALALVLHHEGDKYVDELVGIAHYEHNRYYKLMVFTASITDVPPICPSL